MAMSKDFKKDLETIGEATGNYGTTYRLCCSVYRRLPGIWTNGEIIVGFRGETFDSHDAAILWADMNQKQPNLPHE